MKLSSSQSLIFGIRKNHFAIKKTLKINISFEKHQDRTENLWRIFELADSLIL